MGWKGGGFEEGSFGPLRQDRWRGFLLYMSVIIDVCFFVCLCLQVGR